MKFSCIIFVLFLGLVFSSCSSFNKNNMKLNEKVTIFETPFDRGRNPNKYFKKEYEYILGRRKKFACYGKGNTGRPKNLFGLALSGGGIRANAFHLGILSGLKDLEYNNLSVLDRVDYISSVSGGSWALGAYMASKNPDAMFDALNRIVTNDFTNYDKKYLKLLRNDQTPSPWSKFCKFFLFLDGWWFNRTKKKWQKDIINTHLLGEDLPISEVLSKNYSKPYPIFNSTHSLFTWKWKDEFGSDKHYPFEITPNNIGTNLDRGSSKHGPMSIAKCVENAIRLSRPKGFWLDLNVSNVKTKYLFNTKSDDNTLKFKQLMLSEVMASSSALVNFCGLFTRKIYIEDVNHKNIRHKYKLTDGGKSDNLGLYPLQDRKLKFVIVSNIAKLEDAGPDSQFIIADKQISRSGGDIVHGIVSLHRLEHDNNEGKKSPGLIMYIKPDKTNNKKFSQWLSSKDVDEKIRKLSIKSKNYLRQLSNTLAYYNSKNEDNFKIPFDTNGIIDKEELTTTILWENFPHSATEVMKYDKHLINLYYLFSYYIAQRALPLYKCNIDPYVEGKNSKNKTSQWDIQQFNTDLNKLNEEDKWIIQNQNLY